MATGPWITVGFIPTTTPLHAHRLNYHESGNAPRVDEVVGWLVQHRYDDEKASPVNSRVVAGVVSGDYGQVFPADVVPIFVGVYGRDQAPSSNSIEAARQSWRGS